MLELEFGRRDVLRATGSGVVGSATLSGLTAADDHRAPAGTTVYVVSGTDTLHALDAATGEERWAFEGLALPTDRMNRCASPTVVDGTVYVGQYAVDAETGDEVWETAAPITTSSTVVDGTVYGCSRGFEGLYALDAATGAEAWSFDETYGNVAAPAVADGTVFVTSHRSLGPHRLDAVDAATGASEWTYRSSTGRLRTSPTVVDGAVYVGSVTGLDAVDVGTGKRLSSWGAAPSTAVLGAPVVSDDTVYFGAIGTAEEDFADAWLLAADATSGSLPRGWTRDGAGVADPEDRLVSSPTSRGGTIFVGCDDGTLYAFNDLVGTTEWAFTEPSGAVRSSPTVFGCTVYVGADDGTVYAVDAGTGERRWAFDAPADAVASSPTAVADPSDGHSAGSRVADGTLGHHDRDAASAHVDRASLEVVGAETGEPTSESGGSPIVVATLRNAGDRAEIQEVQLALDGDTVATEERGLTGCRRGRVLFQDVGPLDLRSGVDYTVSTDDDATSGVLLQPGSFEVVDVDPVDPATEKGGTIEVSATLRNAGEAPADTTAEWGIYGDLFGREGWWIQAEEPVELEGGASTSVTFDVDLPDFDPGEYECGVFVGGDATKGALTVESDSIGSGAGVGVVGTLAALGGARRLLERRSASGDP